MNRNIVFLMLLIAVACTSGCTLPKFIFDPDQEYKEYQNIGPMDPEHPERGGII
jgi:hypothetical protein